MFLLNLGYKWTLASEVEAIQGVVVLPCGNTQPRLARSRPDFSWVLFDPQVYLAILPVDECLKVCTRLATFDWFGVHAPEFDSGSMKRREWEDGLRGVVAQTWPGEAPTGGAIGQACFNAISFQQNMRCSHIILPSPMLLEREDEAAIQAEWLDQGLAAAEELDVAQPLLATVAIGETALNEAAFGPGGILETLVDQIIAREGVDGVYIVVAQTGRPAHPFQGAESVDRAYLHLVHAFSTRYALVVVNFADVLGLGCMGVGASGFAGGQSQSLRRLSLHGFGDEGGGRAYPYFYSHPVVGEFSSESDLNAVVQRRLLGVIRDETPHSRPLLEALRSGQTAADVPPWVESQNNIGAAQRHFVHRLVEEGHRLSGMDANERRDHIREWLQQAEGQSLLLRSRVGPGVGRLAPTGNWRDWIEGLVG